MSAGYDSAAAAALAQKAGGTTVIALKEARTLTGVSAGPDDSGAPIARHLGLPVVEFPTVAYRQAPLTTFAEFAAAGDAGDVQFSAMEGHLAGTLFTGGFQGDHMWTRNTERSDDDVVRGDPAGSSLGEFRLRLGFIIVAPAFFAARNLAVRRIGNAPEMAPWTLGTAYDRPIPRRILEVAGVPRTAFGQRKRATAIWSDHLLRDHLIDDALAEWARAQTPRAPAFARRLHDLFYFGVTRWWERYNAAVDRYGRLPHVTCPLPARYQAAVGRWGDVLVQWGVDQVTPRYSALPPAVVADSRS